MADDRVVAVLPGANFGPAVPQLFLPAFAAMRRGAARRALEWPDVKDLEHLPQADFAAWVDARIAGFLDGLTPRRGLVVAKSLGTLAARRIAAAGLPAIWVTPLLTDPHVVAGLRLATAPFLLVGGTADRWWDGVIARELTPHVLELPGADHGLFVPGPRAASVENLGRLAAASERFLDEVVWPDPELHGQGDPAVPPVRHPPASEKSLPSGSADTSTRSPPGSGPRGMRSAIARPAGRRCGGPSRTSA